MKIYFAGNTIFPQYIAPMLLGGGFDQINENAHGGRDTVQREEKYRGGFEKTIKEHHPYILESFFYCDADTERLLPYFGDFLLDSGAFTFIQNSHKKEIDWNEYLTQYADFINRNKIDKFFELDIDSVVGYKQVLKYRDRLEELTNKKCIPVWHKNRGKIDFIETCKKYPYIGLGGIVIKELSQADYKYFPWFINTAHEHDCKIHGLGFTNLKGMKRYKFDSVDSTAWTTGNRFGFLYEFTGTTMRKIKKENNQRIIKPREAALHNYCEWLKFQQYADKYL